MATKKKHGLGAESYFQNLPSLDEQPKTPGGSNNGSQESQKTHAGTTEEKKKVRKTYALLEDTHLALEELRLVERKHGRNVTLGDLMEEAVQLLIREKLPAT